jgi:hypothetical protein
VPIGELGMIAEQRQREGRRLLAEELRPNVRETVALLLVQAIESAEELSARDRPGQRNPGGEVPVASVSGDRAL